jgi:hypothetical protein
VGPKAFQWEGVIKIWTRGQKFAQFSKFSDCNRNAFIASISSSPIPTVYLLSQTESVWRSYHDLFAKANRQKFGMLTVPIQYNPYGHVAGSYHHGEMAGR